MSDDKKKADSANEAAVKARAQRESLQLPKGNNPQKTSGVKTKFGTRNKHLCRARVLARSGDSTGANGEVAAAGRIAPLTKREQSQINHCMKVGAA